MTDQNTTGNGVVIRFVSDGSVAFDIDYVGMVYPLQLIAVAEFLKFQALEGLKEQRDYARSQIVRPQIEVPKGLIK